MEVELPYKAEYAKTGRAGCKGCKTNIDQGSLRIAAMVQSAFADQKQPNWYHEKCFFKKLRPSSAGDITNFENLRFEDQERLKKQIAEVGFVVTAGSAKGGKRAKVSGALKDFGVEYAKSGRATCRGCEQKIIKDVVRVRKTVFDSEVGMKYGGQPLWHHVECFAQMRQDLGWFESGQYLPGFESLKEEDKNIVKKALPAVKSEDVPDAKKPKLEPKTEKSDAEEVAIEKKMKEQNKRLFKFRDSVKAQMSRPDILQLLEEGDQEPVVGDSEKLLDQVADMLTFGAILPCPICKGQQMLFNKSGYMCNGELTEWTKCSNVVKEPKRKALKLSSELKENYKFLKSIAKKPETRVIRYIPPSESTISKNVAVKKDEAEGPKVKRERPALYNFTFSYIGIKDVENLKKSVMKLGGKLISKISEVTIAVFSNEKEVERLGNRMQQAKDLGLHILPVEYIDAVTAKPQAAVQFINSMTLCDWGTDAQARIPQDEKHEKKSIYEKSVPKKITLKVKDGLAVDPDSGLEDSAHVYVEKKDKYNVVLGLTDIQRNKNSYYKIQLLEDDRKRKYYVFRSWGRIGTTIGSNKLEDFSTLHDAKQSFCEVYADKTGNDFKNRENFKKVPGRMYPIDIDYSEDIKMDDANENNVKSKLQPELQKLIKLIFDIEAMKKTMLEFHLDMEKMPLGKLSQKQIKAAYTVLTEIYELIQKSAPNASFIDATNRFYTLIPHNFGVNAPPLLDTTEEVEQLRQMLDSLMEIECAYNLIKTEDDQKDINPVDRHYEQLKTNMDVLPKDSDEFKLLQQYVKNTHAETHNMYDLEVVDIFKVSRQGEARRYKPFKKLHNRKLLWHGSRLTNFAGILSHGLKIAPPEAPATGYMFGKGIYFADMVSKSANYCCTSKQNNTGLLLLSEVALGDMLELTNAKYITRLPKDKHSCFGKGRTQPDPAESIIREDNVEIPMGRPITDNKLKTSLLYNEYIVYDIAQVNIQYLFRVNFNYKY